MHEYIYKMALADQFWICDTRLLVWRPHRTCVPISHLKFSVTAELGQLLVLLLVFLLCLLHGNLFLVVFVLNGFRGVLGGFRGSCHRRHRLQARLRRRGGGLCDGRGRGGGGRPLLKPFVLHALGGCHPGAGEMEIRTRVSDQTLIRGRIETPTSGPWPAAWLWNPDTRGICH